MELYHGDMQLGDTEQDEVAPDATVEPLDVTATHTPETLKQSQAKGAYQIGWETANLSYGGNVEEEAYTNIHSSYKDYSDNQDAYDAWRDVDEWTISSDQRGIYETIIADGSYILDENDNVVPGENQWAGMDLLYNMDAVKGALLAKKNGFTKDTFNAEYSNITKTKSDELAKARGNSPELGYYLGTLAGHVAQPESAIDFMSPGKIMGTSIIKGAAKAFATEAGFAVVGETIREQRTREHMARAGLERTLWDSVETILINSGFAGSIRGIGSAVLDGATVAKIKNGIPDATDKEIFARFAQRENYKLTGNTKKHIDIMDKVKNDIDKGKPVDVAEHLEIDIATKTDDAVEEVSLADELVIHEADKGFPEAAQKFEKEFDETPSIKEVTENDPYEGMTTVKEADEVIAEMSDFSPEIKAELEAIKVEKQALNAQAQKVKDAAEHGDNRFDGKYKLLEKEVKASDIITDGNSIHEQGYDPKGTN